jgi:hypothetical protein
MLFSTSCALLWPQVANQRLKCTNPIAFKVVSSKVLNFIPWLELHHVVFLSPSVQSSTSVFAVDFTPIDQTRPETITSLLKGQWVKGEIRVRYLENASLKDMKRLKEQWSCLQHLTNKESASSIISISEFQSNDTEKMKVLNVIKRMARTWKSDMNFYSHNCQHFSDYAKTICEEEKVCVVVEQ